MEWLSSGSDVLIGRILAEGGDVCEPDSFLKWDIVIVGSGYGASVAASRLARAGFRSICLLERGREYLPGEFPNDIGNAPAQVRLDRWNGTGRRARDDALFDFRFGNGVTTLTARALGGTSQINANVAMRADPRVFQQGDWPLEFRETFDPLDAHYTTVEHWLQVSRVGDHKQSSANGLPLKFRRLADMKRPVQEKLDCRWKGEGVEPEVRVDQALLAVTMIDPPDGTNPYGVEQQACVGCGDCVTGCNHRAKNTLTMNYLPDAYRQGVEMYTGVDVFRVEYDPEEKLYRVFFDETVETVLGRSCRTSGEEAGERKRGKGLFEIHATAVVIAGGVLGSPEILMRSAEGENGLHLSERLGHSVSLNGDSIAFGYDQKEPVNGVGWGSRRPQQMAGKKGPFVGPTITGILDTRFGLPLTEGLVVEDGIVPGAIEGILHEWLTTAGLMAQMSECSVRGDATWRSVDPLAPSDKALKHTQTYLVMGHDKAKGRIRIRDDQGAYIEWPESASDSSTNEEEVLRTCEDLGGIFLDNPALRPLPRKMSDALAGPALRGTQLSVHPLGGVPMGDDFESGVVNHYGAVFDGKSAQSTHPGLFVLDGSIVPTSLGANPFLTIAAIAERAIPFIVQHLEERNLGRHQGRVGAPPGAQFRFDLPPFPDPPPAQYVNPNLQPDGTERDVRLAFKETLRTFVDTSAHPGDPLWGYDGTRPSLRVGRPFKLALKNGGELDLKEGEAVGAALSLDLGPADVRALLEHPDHLIDQVAGTMRLAHHLDDAPKSLDAPEIPVAELKVVSGKVTLLEQIESGGRLSRTLRGLATWQELRGRDETAHQFIGMRLWAAVCQSIRDWSPNPLRDFIRLMWSALVAVVRLAHHSGELRRFHYALELRNEADGQQYHLDGQKDLSFTVDKSAWCALVRLVRFRLRSNGRRKIEDLWKQFGNNWWQSLMDLRVTLAGPGPAAGVSPLAQGVLRLDIVRLAHESIAQIVTEQRVPDTPRGLIGLARIGLVFFRTMLKIHFWDFKAPFYVSAMAPRDLRPGKHKNIERLPECILFSVADKFEELPPPKCGERMPPLRDPGLTLHLTCYARADATKPPNPILLLHGFAQSSTAFINEDVDVDLVTHLHRRDYDVWLLDYRHSIALQSSREVRNLDEAAINDVPRAIDEILAYYRDAAVRSGHSPLEAVTVFGHCMGAVILSMAALSGRLQCEGADGKFRSRVKAAVLSQVPPFIVGGVMSQFKIDLAAFIRDVLKLDVVNLCARGDGGMWLGMADRLMGTFPVGDEVCPDELNYFGPHPQDGIGTCKRISSIIGRLFRHENLMRATHDRLPEYFGWANIAVFAQIAKFFQYERIVNADGGNVYATRTNIHAHMDFPVLFLHGQENVVFDEESARRSCEEFQRANPNVPYGLAIVPKYAHYDCIVGWNAEVDVFPRVTDFLRNPASADPALASGDEAGSGVVSTLVMVPEVGPWLTSVEAGPGGLKLELKVTPNRSWSVPPQKTYAFENAPVTPRPFEDRTWDIGDPPVPDRDADTEPDRSRRSYQQKIRVIREPLGLQAQRASGPTVLAADVITLAGEPPVGIDGDGRELLKELDKRIRVLHRCSNEPELRSLSRILLSPLKLDDATVRIDPAVVEACHADDAIAFFSSCCRHPGTGFDRRLSDRTYGGMLDRLRRHCGFEAPAGTPVPRLCLLVGDQIYADAMGGVFDTEQPIEKFVERYYRAFSSPNYRTLARQLPIHMTIDDHEIQDNFSRDMIEGDPGMQDLAASGLEAALAFQGRDRVTEADRRKLWYPMCRSDFRFFLLDTRSARLRGKVAGTSIMMEPAQWDALEAWLADLDRERPKFIVSGSVMLPRSLETVWAYERDVETGHPHRPETRGDCWSAFPEEQARLLDAIARHRLNNVVFVSGDYHTSSFSTLTFRHEDGRPELKAYSVVSPPAYAPFPFANDRADRIATKDILRLPSGLCVCVDTKWALDGSGFTEVLARASERGWEVAATWYDQRGRPVTQVP